MVVQCSSNIFPPKSVSVAASRPSRVRLPKRFAGSSMKRGLPRLSLWTFSRWRKFLLPTDLNEAFVVTTYLTDNLISELLLTYSTRSRQPPPPLQRIAHDS